MGDGVARGFREIGNLSGSTDGLSARRLLVAQYPNMLIDRLQELSEAASAPLNIVFCSHHLDFVSADIVGANKGWLDSQPYLSARVTPESAPAQKNKPPPQRGPYLVLVEAC